MPPVRTASKTYDVAAETRTLVNFIVFLPGLFCPFKQFAMVIKRYGAIKKGFTVPLKN